MELEKLLNEAGLPWFRDSDGVFLLPYQGGINVYVVGLGESISVRCPVMRLDDGGSADQLTKAFDLQRTNPGKYFNADRRLWFAIDLPGVGLTAEAIKWAVGVALENRAAADSGESPLQEQTGGIVLDW